MTSSRKGPTMFAMARGAVILAYSAAAFAPLGAMIAFDSARREQGMLPSVGAGLALTAFSVLALQPVLAARLHLLDRLFGLDIVYVFHKIMGMTGATLLACGVVMLSPAFGWRAHTAGIAASGILIVLGLTAFLYRQLGMTYEAWRVLHNALALSALAISFIEAYRLAINAAPARVLTVVLLLIAVAAYAQHRVIGPAMRRKRPYRVGSVTRETPNVWTLAFEPPKGAEPFDYLPGQFQFLTFDGGRGEEHPFTISSSPSRPGFHASTIKESGDFTRTIGRIRPGDRVAVQAPFGRFSYALHPAEKDLVFIAGGIGITPLMSMLRHMADAHADRNVLLLYANNTEEDIAFRGELDAIAAGKSPRLTIVHVLGRPGDAWKGERGFVGKALVEKYVQGKIADQAFYVCGPPPMMSAVINLLIELGARPGRIRSERFAL